MQTGSENESQDALYHKAANEAICLIGNCFLAREERKLNARNSAQKKRELLTLAPLLSYPKGVRYITGSRTLGDKLSAFKAWLSYLWLQQQKDLFSKSYPVLVELMQSTEDGASFAARAIEVLKKHGFTSVIANAWRARFQMFYTNWTIEQKSEGGKTTAKKNAESKNSGHQQKSLWIG